MGKAQDVLDWFKENTKKVKDSFGTGIEALNPKNIADTVTSKVKKK